VLQGDSPGLRGNLGVQVTAGQSARSAVNVPGRRLPEHVLRAAAPHRRRTLSSRRRLRLRRHLCRPRPFRHGLGGLHVRAASVSAGSGPDTRTRSATTLLVTRTPVRRRTSRPHAGRRRCQLAASWRAAAGEPLTRLQRGSSSFFRSSGQSRVSPRTSRDWGAESSLSVAVSRAIRPVAWNASWNELPENCVRPVLSVHTRAASVQAERSGRRSFALLIRGFGVQVPGGAPALTWCFYLIITTAAASLVAVIAATRPRPVSVRPACLAAKRDQLWDRQHVLAGRRPASPTRR